MVRRGAARHRLEGLGGRWEAARRVVAREIDVRSGVARAADTRLER